MACSAESEQKSVGRNFRLKSVGAGRGEGKKRRSGGAKNDPLRKITTKKRSKLQTVLVVAEGYPDLGAKKR